MLTATKPRRAPARHTPDPTAKTRYLLAERVLALVGRPPDLLRIEVRLVEDDAYRVNLVTENRGVVCRAHSWYIQTDRDGLITASNPALTDVQDPQRLTGRIKRD